MGEISGYQYEVNKAQRIHEENGFVDFYCYKDEKFLFNVVIAKEKSGYKFMKSANTGDQSLSEEIDNHLLEKAKDIIEDMEPETDIKPPNSPI